MPNKKVFKKKGLQFMFNGSDCDRKSQLSGILTEPLNLRELKIKVYLKLKIRYCLLLKIQIKVIITI